MALFNQVKISYNKSNNSLSAGSPRLRACRAGMFDDRIILHRPDPLYSKPWKREFPYTQLACFPAVAGIAGWILVASYPGSMHGLVCVPRRVCLCSHPVVQCIVRGTSTMVCILFSLICRPVVLGSPYCPYDRQGTPYSPNEFLFTDNHS